MLFSCIEGRLFREKSKTGFYPNEMDDLRAANQINFFIILNMEILNTICQCRYEQTCEVLHDVLILYGRDYGRRTFFLCLKTHYIPILRSNLDTIHFLVVINSHLFQVGLVARVGVCPRCREGWAAVEGGSRPSTAACVASCAG